MIDASKFPKTAQIQKLREDREESRLKALRDDAKAAVAIKQRCKKQQDECRAAEKKIAKRKGPR